MKKLFLKYLAGFSLSKKLFAAFVLTAFFSVSFFSSVVYLFLKIHIKTDIHRDLTSASETVVNHVKVSLQEAIKNYLRGVAEKNKDIVAHYYSQFQEGKYNSAEFETKVRDLISVQKIGAHGYLYILSKDGIILMHPQKDLIGKQSVFYSDFQKSPASIEGFYEYTFQMKKKGLYRTIFAPANWVVAASAYQSEFASLLDQSDLSNKISHLKLGETGYIYIIDTKGNIIDHPSLKGNYFDATDSDGNFFIKEVCEQKNGDLWYNWKNPNERKFRRKYAVYEYLPDFDWIVISSCYLDEYEKPLKTIRWILLITLFISFLFIFPIVYFLSRQISYPLKAFIHQLEYAIKGDYSVRMDNCFTPEYRALSEYFNHFMGNLEKEISERKNAQTKLQNHRNQLKDLVSQRTQALTRINSKLKVEINNKKQINQEKEKLLQELDVRNKHLEELAITDGLTGLFNHKRIIEILSQRINEAKRYNVALSVIMIDIDHFKNVNDQYGHLYGDHVLQIIASSLKNSLREVDRIGRYGGEEFLIVLPQTNTDRACATGEKLRKKIESLQWDFDNNSITICCGVASYSLERSAELIAKADRALYKAKASGRNCVICSSL